MSRLIDMTGLTFGRLTVLRRVGVRKWQCLCSCGALTNVRGPNLRRGLTQSCGCLMREFREAGHPRLRHGAHDTPEYNIWSCMKQRCQNPNNRAYPDYGGRGITIDPSWAASFEAFFRDMGPRPSPAHSIDRKDVNGPYCRDNCRWATEAEQRANTRTTVLIPVTGEVITQAEAARRTGLSPSLLHYRIKAHGVDSSRLLAPTSNYGRQLRT